MEGTPRGPRTYYGCALRTMVPGSPALKGHPTNVYLPEAAAMEHFNKWIDHLFDPANVDNAVLALLAISGQRRDRHAHLDGPKWTDGVG
jgi:hypothetical protein